MNKTNRNEILAILIMASLFLLVGFGQSWSLSLSILNMCIISAIMAMGINIQWGYAGIFNVGIMGFTALGGLAAVLVSYSPVGEAWRVGGIGNPIGAVVGGYVIAFSEIMVTYAYKKFFIYLLPQSLEPSGLVQLLSTDYKFAVSFSILVIVLLIRPSGIFKGRTL